MSRERNPELFAAVLGGYGGVGIILEAELDVVPNVRMKRRVDSIALDEYHQWFAANIQANSQAVMHNADLAPPHFNAPIGITWEKTTDPLTDHTRLLPVGARYSKNQNMIWAATEFPMGDKLREHYITGRMLSEPKVIWRNLEASLDAASLEPRTRLMSTYLLQEYFVPVEAFSSFLVALRKVVGKYDPNLLNISIRHAPKDTHSTLAWAKSEVFCFVLYYKQRNFPWVDGNAAHWTRELVAAALDHDGRHYLPYRLHATKSQVHRGYEGADAWLAAKAQVDPESRLRNLMLDKYLLR